MNERNWWTGWATPLYWLAFWLLIVAVLLFGGAALFGQEYSPPSECRYAVIQLPSHGGSATVIYTAPGRTILLSCAHMFQGRDRSKPVVGLLPAAGGSPIAGTAPRVLEVDTPNDLSLIELRTGPLPYCCPVAPAGAVYSRRCLSVGYDELKKPAQMRVADIEDYGHGRGSSDGRIYTRQRPWHGRSGGALIDEQNGWLVGVVSGYTGPSARSAATFAESHPSGQGIYAGHGAIVALLRRNGIEPGTAVQTPAPLAQRFAPSVPRRRPDCPT